MKRSEVLNIIYKAIEHFHPETGGEVASLVLNEIEKAGMQPPAIKEPCETFVLFQGKHVKTEDSFMFTHKWDEEDVRE